MKKMVTLSTQSTKNRKMKRVLFIFAIVLLSQLPMTAGIRGDVNGDGRINVSDVTALINDILGTEVLDEEVTDVNGDGQVNVSDVTDLINRILNGIVEKTGYDYVWDYDATTLPELHITVSVAEWNRLLTLYDANHHTKQYIVAKQATFVKDGETTVIDSIGLRLKGNTSRRRPEGWGGGWLHQTDNADWHHVHFGINLRKYVKDDEHTIQGVRKLHLKWFKDDPMMVREVYCYDLFRRFGIWTAADDTYCRLWIHVDCDKEPAYYGVYEMIEPVDENFLKRRKDEAHFGTAKGNLWKCKYVNGMANLANPYNADYWYDDDSDENHTYTLQTNTKRFDNAKAQLTDFMLKLNGKGDESFYQWIHEVCDVDLLLKTYAMSVALGQWDDYWNNGNNYYLYFTTEDLYDYKFYLIPYDYDNTLGTTNNCGVQTDAGRHDPTNWGLSEHKLIKRLMDFDDLRAKYVAYLKEIVAEESRLLHYDASKPRIEAWHDMIRDYVENDTGEDMEIRDEPAGWGNHGEYRLLEDGANNFLRVHAATINALQ